MSAKSALIWVSVSIAIVFILYISYIIYKKYIAQYFDESARQRQSTNVEVTTSQPLADSSQPPFNPTFNTTGSSAPSYSEACLPPAAPPTYDEAVASSK